ncbi:unnamed protein product [Staurois parvus]|uniref:Uncharacterized protein n=1 Tax=Staurois parvus TaxID=386267 RepID=A0ABN9DCM1_9NEOB|nr:unnamed protein product [Staurois parvus]
MGPLPQLWAKAHWPSTDSCLASRGGLTTHWAPEQ